MDISHQTKEDLMYGNYQLIYGSLKGSIPVPLKGQ